MPYKKQFDTVEVRFTGDAGSLCSDLSYDSISPKDWSRKDNWRRVLDCEVVREGWDYWRPNQSQPITNQKYTGVTGYVLAAEEIRNPAGNSAIVAVVDSTIRRFDFATGAWVQIGSGFQTYASTGGAIRRWQIVQLNGAAVFNNGVDLPVYWRIGMASVLPIYELREKGVASVGRITEYSGFLMAADVTEVNAAYMTTLMNGASPYGLVPVPATNTSRTQYRMVWSNASDALDWGATVNYSGTSGSNAITLAWPMSSFFVGKTVTLIGGGPSGGNLVTTIATIAGTALTVADNLSTTVSGVPISASSALGSAVGYYDIQDDSSAITQIMPLQNRLIVYRERAIFVGTYTGQVDFPFQFDRVYQGSRTPKLPNTLVNVRGEYHLYAGADYFYQYKLGSLEPDLDPVLFRCGKLITQFPYSNLDIEYQYAADNTITGEIWFNAVTSVFDPILTHTLCYDYVNATASSIPHPPMFTSMRSVKMPLTGDIGDSSNYIFIIGDRFGNITQYGLTSAAGSIVMMPRYGFSYGAQLDSGFLSFGDAFNEKDLRTYVPLIKQGSGAPLLITTAYSNRADKNFSSGTNAFPIAVGSTGLAVVPTWQRGIYHQVTLSVFVPSTNSNQLKIAGQIFEVDMVGTRSITRMT